MGNLLSFPVLCLLNRACWGIMNSLRTKRSGVRSKRSVLINGDDIAFAGDSLAFDDWKLVTSHFGLVVNKEKTGVSREWLELNSRSFLLREGPAGILVRPLRKPVLSCLMPGLDSSCLLTRLWDGLRTLSPATLRLAIVELRYDIITRGVTLTGIPKRLRLVLLKEAWFRQALFTEPDLIEWGVKRCWPVVPSDVRPPDSLLPLYERGCRELLRVGVSLARGVKVLPYGSTVRKVPVTRPCPRGRVSLKSYWVWRWPRPLLSWWESSGLPTQKLGDSSWCDDHPDLAVKWLSVVTNGVRPPDSLLVGVNVSGFVLWPNGLV